jgi:ABC-type microcin C transport system duplicated ATPase subunit YejF
VLLDKPFAGVDPIAVIEIQRIVRFLKERGIGVLMTDHNVRETLGICDRAYIINAGTVLASGRPDEIVDNESVRRVYPGRTLPHVACSPRGIRPDSRRPRNVETSLQLRVSQHLALTPQLQQSIRLLQLSTLELQRGDRAGAVGTTALLERLARSVGIRRFGSPLMAASTPSRSCPRRAGRMGHRAATARGTQTSDDASVTELGIGSGADGGSDEAMPAAEVGRGTRRLRRRRRHEERRRRR